MKPTLAIDAQHTDPRLPQILAEIADATSLGTALVIVHAYGGTRLYVPEHPKKGMALYDLIGADDALALAELFGGDRIDVPLFSYGRTAQLDRRIKEMALAGASRPDIARDLGITERTVYRHLSTRPMKAKRNDPRQTDLEDWLNALSKQA